MALIPVDEVHALQIQAGTLGRKAGHAFEDSICAEINGFSYPRCVQLNVSSNLLVGDPAALILDYVTNAYGETSATSAIALSTGALATSDDGRKWLSINGVNVRRCKSDIVLTITFASGRNVSVGISTKQCNNPTPTNAQLYFTTATGFTNLLNINAFSVSSDATDGLRRFCGNVGFRPLDNPQLTNRKSDPRRYFWEEIGSNAISEWEYLFTTRQNDITRLLLQKAYFDDPFVPEFLLHKTKKAPTWATTEVAIYSIEELIMQSQRYQGFATKPYAVRKGSYPDPSGITHLAPRFGVVQMQRGGQAQHPTQLQFNLEAGYFYRLANAR